MSGRVPPDLFQRGSGKYDLVTIKASGTPWDFKDYSLVFDVPAYGVVAFEFDYVKPIKNRLRAGTKIVRKKLGCKKYVAKD